MNMCICKILIICVAVICSESATDSKWRDMPINMRRAIGSMTSAAKFLEVTFVKGLSAKEFIEDNPDFDLYRVKFIARSNVGYETDLTCKADVRWEFPAFKRVVYNASCRPKK